MVGKMFCATKEEYEKGVLSYEYINKPENKRRIIPFSFEESSIDVAINSLPRFVVDGKVYEHFRQYFIKTSDTNTDRLIIVYPTKNG